MGKKIFALLIGCVLLFEGCGSSNEVSNETSFETEAVTVETKETEIEETEYLEVYYEDDDLINRYLNNFNTVNLSNQIEKGSFEKYYHHGREHDNQIIFTYNGFEIVISGGFKLDIVISGDKSYDEYKEVFFQYAKGYSDDLSDQILNDYWNGLLNDLTNSMRFDEFECRLDIFEDKIELMQLYGELK